MRNQIREKVLYVLDRYPDTRNDDIVLTLQIWRTYFYHRIFKGQDGIEWVKLREIVDLPREDHIKRIRAIIQNEEHNFLPTRVDIAIKRGMSEAEWRDYLQYPPAVRWNKKV